MKASDIMAAVAEKYAAMHSYQDQGFVIINFPGKEIGQETTFSTYFLRPNRFRFDWTTHHPYSGLRHLLTRQVIWCNGSESFSYSDREKTTRSEENLSMAIAGATGVSYGAAHTISNLLMEEVGGYLLPDLERSILSEDVWDGVPCHRVSGYHPKGSFHEVYVGIHDLIIRCVREPDRKGVVIDEIRRDIRVNEPVSEETFQFLPPTVE